MNTNLLVRMEIPVRAERIGRPMMIFESWPPLKDDDFILVQEEKTTLKFWLDTTCLRPQPDFLPQEPVSVHKILADVTVVGLSDELVKFILDGRRIDSVLDQSIAQGIEKLAERVFAVTVKYLNRLITYLRTRKGQYWLEEYPTEKYRAYAFLRDAKATVRAEDSKWVAWLLPSSWFGTGWPADESRYIGKDDWLQAGEFVNSTRSSPLVWELLAGAELLAGTGHRRSALTEAITALEVAISNFAKQHQDNAIFATCAKRMNLPSLPKLIDGHLGLRGTIYYLFPVIFTEEQMPTELLKNCQEAIEQRGNVIHRGQRDVKQEDLFLFLQSIRQICIILESYQREESA